MASMQRASRLGTPGNFPAASMYATTRNGRMMLLHARAPERSRDPAALQFTIQALLTNQRKRVRPLAERLGARPSSGATRRASSPSRPSRSGTSTPPKASPVRERRRREPLRRAVRGRVRQHIQTQRANAEPAGPPTPPARRSRQRRPLSAARLRPRPRTSSTTHTCRPQRGRRSHDPPHHPPHRPPAHRAGRPVSVVPRGRRGLRLEWTRRRPDRPLPLPRDHGRRRRCSTTTATAISTSTWSRWETRPR